MKHFYFFRFTFLVSLLFTSYVNAQYTAIPDSQFEQHLISQAIDSEGTLDGQVLTSDIAVVSNLDISNSGMSDLTGIEDFTALTTLKATFVTSLTSLDVSGLTLLADLDLSMSFNMNSLIVTGCTGLADLDIRFTNLSALDLSTCISITTIDLYRSSGLQNLDLSGKTSLTSITADESALQTLNVSGCTSLSSININETSVNTLDLTNNTAITSLTIYDAFINSLNLTNCTNLSYMFLQQCNNLSALDLTNCISLTNFNLESNNALSGIDFSSLTNLESVYLSNTSIPDVDLSSNIFLTSVSINNSSTNTLDLRNSHNTNITSFFIYSTNLACVNVDDDVYSTANWTNIDPTIFFDKDCEALSIDENSIASISLFPNPSQNYIRLSGVTQELQYQVYTVTGKTMFSGSIQPNQQIDILNLSKGVYFLQLDNSQTLKFVKS